MRRTQEPKVKIPDRIYLLWCPECGKDVLYRQLPTRPYPDHFRSQGPHRRKKCLGNARVLTFERQ